MTFKNEFISGGYDSPLACYIRVNYGSFADMVNGMEVSIRNYIGSINDYGEGGMVAFGEAQPFVVEIAEAAAPADVSVPTAFYDFDHPTTNTQNTQTHLTSTISHSTEQHTGRLYHSTTQQQHGARSTQCSSHSSQRSLRIHITSLAARQQYGGSSST